MAVLEDGTKESPGGSPNQIELNKRGFSLRLESLTRSPVGTLGILIVSITLLLGAFGPLISPHDPNLSHLGARFKLPGYSDETGRYILGTDQLGRDVLSRVIAGSRVSVIIGLISATIAGLIGVTYGVVSGYTGGLLDTILMRVADALLGIPYIVLVVAVSGVLGPGLRTLILILAVTGWVTYARVARSEVLVVRELDYVTAARVVGRSDLGIMFRHALPNVVTSAIILAALQVGTTILAESSLSFLGLGVQPPTVTWGLMLAEGRIYMGSAWWMAAFPGLAITFTVLGVVFVGDWLRDVLDPRLHGHR